MSHKLILGLSIPLLLLALLAGAYIQGGQRDLAALVSSGELLRRLDRNPLTPQPVMPRTDLGSAITISDPDARLAMLQQWAETVDSKQMTELLEEINLNLSPQELRPVVRQALLFSWSRRDMAGLGAWFGARYAADELHQESRDALLNALTEGKSADAFSWMENALPHSAREELYGPFFRHWADRYPAEASAKLLQLTKTETENLRWNALLGEVVGQWSEKELVSAVTWTKSLPSGIAKSKALEQLSYRWAKIDPLAAATYAAAQNDPAALEAVASTWAAGDPKSAHRWAFELPEGEGRNRAVATATAIWAGNAPATAAEYVEGLPEGEGQNQARIAVAARWAETEAAKAAKWTERFPENSAREQAVAQVITAWAASDAKEAGKWLQNLPESRSRDAALLAYCAVLEATESAAAFAWAESISDAELRRQRQEMTASLWLAKNPVAARNAIASSSLPEDLKKQLLLRTYQSGSIP